MKKNQLLNIKKMIFELGRGGSKNHFFDRVNDVRKVDSFFACAQNNAGAQTGRSMLELVCVLGIAGVLSLTSLYFFSSIKSKVVINELYEKVQQKVVSLKGMDLTHVAPETEVVIDGFDSSKDNIRIIRLDENDASNAGAAYIIQLSDLTKEECIEFLHRPLNTPFILTVGGRDFDPDNPDYSVCDAFNESLNNIFIFSAYAGNGVTIDIPMPPDEKKTDIPKEDSECQDGEEYYVDYNTRVAGCCKNYGGFFTASNIGKISGSDLGVCCAEGEVPNAYQPINGTGLKFGCCPKGSPNHARFTLKPWYGKRPEKSLCCPAYQRPFYDRITQQTGCCDHDADGNPASDNGPIISISELIGLDSPQSQELSGSYYANCCGPDEVSKRMGSGYHRYCCPKDKPWSSFFGSLIFDGVDGPVLSQYYATACCAKSSSGKSAELPYQKNVWLDENGNEFNPPIVSEAMCCAKDADIILSSIKKKKFSKPKTNESSDGAYVLNGYIDVQALNLDYSCCALDAPKGTKAHYNSTLVDLEKSNEKMSEDAYLLIKSKDNNMCCQNDDSKAFWNGSEIKCCEDQNGAGEIFLPQKEKKHYECCLSSNGKSKNHVVDVQSAIAKVDDKACCPTEAESAFWKGDEKTGKAECCIGEVFLPSVSDGYKCCSYSYDETQKTYLKDKKVVKVNTPNGVLEICCPVKDGKEPMGYWDGKSAQCCLGDGIYEIGNGVYSCCPYEEKEENGQNILKKIADVVPIVGGQEGFTQLCCEILDLDNDGIRETSQTAFWTGSGAECCAGEVIKVGENQYSCCNGTTGTQKTHVKVSVSGAPNGEEACCEIATYGETPTAFWNGKTTGCCKNGYVSITNYDSAGNNIGTTCCETKEDGVDSSGYDVSDYTVGGAINGTCCGGYKVMNSGEYGTPASEKNNFNYKINVNGGVAYCAKDAEQWRVDQYGNIPTKPTEKRIYISAGKYCDYEVGGCWCSDSGDPRYSDNVCEIF